MHRRMGTQPNHPVVFPAASTSWVLEEKVPTLPELEVAHADGTSKMPFAFLKHCAHMFVHGAMLCLLPELVLFNMFDIHFTFDAATPTHHIWVLRFNTYPISSAYSVTVLLSIITILFSTFLRPPILFFNPLFQMVGLDDILKSMEAIA